MNSWPKLLYWLGGWKAVNMAVLGGKPLHYSSFLSLASYMCFLGGEAALSLAGRKILSNSGLVCPRSVCVTQIMQPNRPDAVKEKVCHPPCSQSEGHSTDSFFPSSTFSILRLIAYRKLATSTCRSSAHIPQTASQIQNNLSE